VSQPRRRRALVGTVTVLATLLVLVVIGGLIQLNRPLPAPYVVTSLPATYTIPGAAPVLPWPTSGQAGVEVLGVGSLGAKSGGTTPVPIASVAKIMTAYVILTDHPLAAGANGPTITITAADVADYRNDVAHNDSATAVAVGEKLSEREALEALLIPSADNVARLLATWDAGSIDAFLAKMNSTATALGMVHTHYTDPSGLEASTTSTASDQIRLAERAMAMPMFATIVALKKVTLPVAGVVKNYNALLGRDGVIGIKTGSTSAAGGCLVFAAHRTVAGHTYTIIGAVLGQGRTGPFVSVLPKVMTASHRLIRVAETALHSYPILHQGQHVADLYGPFGAHTAIRAGADIAVVGWPGLTYQLSTHVDAMPRVSAGSTLGSIQASGHGAAATVGALNDEALTPPSLIERLKRG
jgi:D-alanyl-D-alanine carboxypeptidase (penicillin-binding protein 5/6)